MSSVRGETARDLRRFFFFFWFMLLKCYLYEKLLNCLSYYSDSFYILSNHK